MSETPMLCTDAAASRSLQQMVEQAAPSKDILDFIAKQWPQEVFLIIDKAAGAYKVARESLGDSDLKRLDAHFSSSDSQDFRFWALLGKALSG